MKQLRILPEVAADLAEAANCEGYVGVGDEPHY
jgi:hypothetical protein